VLAGPFAAYQLAVLGADVIKVEDPNEPDQSRESGVDMALNKARMGTSFLTQASNKRSIARYRIRSISARSAPRPRANGINPLPNSSISSSESVAWISKNRLSEWIYSLAKAWSHCVFEREINITSQKVF